MTVLGLDDPVTTVDGVGPATARHLGQLGVETVRDLVEHYPRRYQDLGELQPIDLARPGEPVTIVGTVVDWTHRRTRTKRGGRSLVISEATVRDRNGSTFTATFFNQRWRARRLSTGTVAAFSGDLEYRFKKLQIAMPSVQELGRGDPDRHADALEYQRMIPVYPATESLPTWKIGELIDTALGELPPFEEFLPETIRDSYDLIDRDEAVRGIHAPDDRRHADAARERLTFDELFTLQVGLQWRRARLEADVVGTDNSRVEGKLADRFLGSLPFEPTGAQRRAFDELDVDLGADRPMHRLLQGDVGSGKTLVATWTMLCAVDHDRQAALMAPTEVLAEQHFRTLTEQLAPLGVNVLDGIRVELLTSGTTISTKRRVLGELLSGRVDIVVGTHALLEEGVRFDDLGVVVIDEQHRFGVHQRVRLMEKGGTREDGGGTREDGGGTREDGGGTREDGGGTREDGGGTREDGGGTREDGGGSGDASAPDVLVMTATPIPRSLALTLFGDLDVTVLDEMPPGRHEIVTQLITPDQAHRRENLYGFIREQAQAGHQTYVVCPLVEESEEVAARAAEAEAARLRDEVFPDLQVGLVHGRMKGDDKEAAMAAFRRGETHILVATTVIEVGVDVPNATVMVIEDADRFGISQLHQLRGRVGRGAARSYCVLFAGWSGQELTDDAVTRLRAVAGTTDGFELAETDLELRGEGQLFGVRQSGMPDLKLARLARDKQLVEITRDAAQELVADDPELDAPELRSLREEVRRRYRGGLEELEALATG